MKDADLLVLSVDFSMFCFLALSSYWRNFSPRRETSQFQMIRFQGELQISELTGGFQSDKFVNIFLDTIAKRLGHLPADFSSTWLRLDVFYIPQAKLARHNISNFKHFKQILNLDKPGKMKWDK